MPYGKKSALTKKVMKKNGDAKKLSGLAADDISIIEDSE